MPVNELQLTQRTIYIVPTPSGWLFGGLLLCLLVASINYQLNLGHLLTFALASAGVVALHATHGTLRGLTLTAREGEPGFVGQTLEVQVIVRDPAPAATWRQPMRLGRHGLGLRWVDETELAWVEVQPADETVIQLPRHPTRRGRQALPALILESRYPLGLFRAWTVWRIALQPMAWPEPEKDPPALPLDSTPSGPRTTTRVPQQLYEPDDDAGVRPWRREDRPNQVLWKLSARSLAAGGDLLVREPAPPRHTRELHLDMQALQGLDPERRISRLTAWVLAADQSGQRYRMSLPGERIEAGSGAAQRRHCLDTLATWGHPS